MLKCKIGDNHLDTPVRQRNATIWFQYNRSIKRGIRGYNGINVRSNYLANFAPKISKLSTIANAIFGVTRPTAGTEIENDEIGLQQCVKPLIKLNRRVHSRESACPDLRKKSDPYVYIHE